MSRFLKTPNLPEARVTLCALASGNFLYTQSLQEQGVKALEIPAHPLLAEPVCRHADLQIHHLGGGVLLTLPDAMPGLLFALSEEKFDVKPICFTPNSVYPNDIPLCCFALGNALYCSPQHTASEIKALYKRILAVRQGYARCSTCIVDANAIITADTGIAAVAERQGIAVLRIQPGHILLPGYSHGFIGGCCGLLNKRLLAFTGEINTHPDGARIRAFCRRRGVQIIALGSGPLVDIGGILPLKEKCD